MVPPLDDVQLLLERDAERGELQRLLDRAATGAGGVAVVSGPAGIGKSRLADAARAWAVARGFQTARANGAVLEQEFAFGAVRQLFEPLVAASDDPDELLSGAAAVAAPLCGRHTAAPGDHDLAPGTVLHGLYWVTAGLAERSPLALVCDDAHWFDLASLRFLAYLTHRVAELPVAVILAARVPEPGPESEVLRRVVASAGVRSLRLGPLTPEAVERIVEATVERPARDGVGARIAELSGGNPFLVHEAVRAVRSAAGDPRGLGVGDLALVRPSDGVLGRLGQLRADALHVARAVAVLGADAHLRHVAALAGLDIDAAGAAADELLRADILGPGRPLAFVHPLVAAAVEQDMLPGERSARHRRAARLLLAEGAPPERVARHYMSTDPAGDGTVVDVLDAAARSSLAQGATDVSITLLRRALDEPPTAAQRLRIVIGLGTAELHLLDVAAIDHLGEAIDQITDPRLEVLLATARAVTLCVHGRPAEAVASLRQLDAEVAGDPTLHLELLAGLNFVGATGPDAASLVIEETAELLRTVGHDDDASPAVLGVRAYIGACSGEDVDAVAAMASRALAAVIDDDPTLPTWFHLPVAALIMADRDRDAADVIEHRLTAARRNGAPGQVSMILFMRAMVALRAGDLPDAAADAHAALEQCVDHGIGYVLPGPLAILVDVRREQGDLDGADALLEQHALGRGDGNSLFDLFLLAARARLRGAQTRWEETFADLHRGWQLGLGIGILSPNLIPWQSNLALGLALAGRLDDAAIHAREALQEAELFGSARCRAEAQRALAMSGIDGGADLARAAASTYASLGARLEESRTLIALGHARELVGTSAAAEALVECIRLAERCDAPRVALLARTRLDALGVRRRIRPVSGVGALTASERRVAALAAGGHTNKEVAQQLFVTVKTVETHLARSFQKLGISNRRQLPHALTA